MPTQDLNVNTSSQCVWEVGLSLGLTCFFQVKVGLRIDDDKLNPVKHFLHHKLGYIIAIIYFQKEGFKCASLLIYLLIAKLEMLKCWIKVGCSWCAKVDIHIETSLIKIKKPSSPLIRTLVDRSIIIMVSQMWSLCCKLQLATLCVKLVLLQLPEDWNTLVVGKVSPWINTDSNDDIERKNSEQVRCWHTLMYLLITNLAAGQNTYWHFKK